MFACLSERKRERRDSAVFTVVNVDAFSLTIISFVTDTICLLRESICILVKC